MRESIYIIKTQLLCVCLTHPLSWYFYGSEFCRFQSGSCHAIFLLFPRRYCSPEQYFLWISKALLFSIPEDPLTGVRHYNPTNGNCPGIGSPMTSVYLSNIDLTTSLFIFASDLRSIERSECQKMPAYESN